MSRLETLRNDAAIKPVTITLQKIRDASPCREGWEQVLKSRGPNPDYDAPFPLADIIASNCLDHAIWALRCVDKIHAQRFAIGCAKLVLHLMKDQRSIDVVAMAERYVNGHVTLNELIKCRRNAAAYIADAAAAAAYAAAADAADVAAAYAAAAAADVAADVAAAADADVAAAADADVAAAYAAAADARNAARKEMRSKQETLLRQICGEVQQ